jgi:hypothetical protein
MIWRDGVLPPGSPAFSQQLSFDLHSYAYGLLGLGLGLRLLELDGDPLEDGFDILPPEAPPSTHETPGAETPPASPNSAPRSKTWRFDDE